MENIKEIMHNISKYMQYVYLFLFTGILIKYYLLTTMLENNYSYNIYRILKWLLFVYIILNMIITVFNNGYASWFDIVLSVLILGCGGIVSYNLGEDQVFDIAMLIVGAKNVSWRKIAYCYLCVAIIIQVIAIYGAHIGVVSNVTYISVDRGIRKSFGIIYPTDFVAHLLFIMLTYVSLRDDKLTAVEIVIMELIGYAAYQQTYARNDFICITSLCVLLYIVKQLRIFEIQLSSYKVIKFGAISMLIIVIICIIGATLYNPSSQLFNKLDSLLSGRIQLSYQGLAKYGIKPFGSIVAESTLSSNYFFLDSSFIRIAIRYGGVFLSIIIYVYFVCYIKMVNYHKDNMIVVFIIMVLFGITEHHLIEIAYCPIWYILFAKIKPDKLIKKQININN